MVDGILIEISSVLSLLLTLLGVNGRYKHSIFANNRIYEYRNFFDILKQQIHVPIFFSFELHPRILLYIIYRNFFSSICIFYFNFIILNYLKLTIYFDFFSLELYSRILLYIIHENFLSSIACINFIWSQKKKSFFFELHLRLSKFLLFYRFY